MPPEERGQNTAKPVIAPTAPDRFASLLGALRSPSRKIQHLKPKLELQFP